VKERLTGAIILVVLIVLLVPELLSGPSRPAPAPQAAAPSSSSTEDPPLRSYTIDLADESHGATPSAGNATNVPPQSGPAQPATITEHPAQDASTAQQPPGAAGPATEAAPQASSQTAQTPTPAAAPLPPKSATPPAPTTHAPATERAGAGEKPASGGWVVQVGVFAKQANAQRLVRELQEQGFRTQISENRSGGRTLWWVRTHPVAERAAAEQLSTRLRAAGHVGSVVPK